MAQFVTNWDDHPKKPWPELGPRGTDTGGHCDYGLACNMPARVEHPTVSMYFFPDHEILPEHETRHKEWHVSFARKGLRTRYFQTMGMLLDIKDFLGDEWGYFVSECGRTVSTFDPSVADFIESECPYRGFSGQAGQR